jgi:peptide/nickel transport system permease protein
MRVATSRPAGRVALGILAIVLILGATGSLLAPHGPLAVSLDTFKGISWNHPWGTDYLGRDALSRVIAGTRATVLMAGGIVILAGLLGVLPGMGSALVGRTGEFVLLRVVETLMTFPPVIFAIAIVGMLGNGMLSVTVAVGVLLAPRFFRVMRAETLVLASTQYVEAAQLMGASRLWLIRCHLWGKVMPTAAVVAATSMAWAVLASASLTFLGLGTHPPAPTWGGVLATDVQYVASAPYAAIWPGLVIVLTVWSLNTLADSLRSALSPAVGAILASGAAVEPDALVAVEPAGGKWAEASNAA